jgi:hypothetical protein
VETIGIWINKNLPKKAKPSQTTKKKKNPKKLQQ